MINDVLYRTLDVLNEAELRETAELSAAAMNVDSMWAYIFGKGVLDPLAWLFSKHLILTAGTTTIAVDVETGNVIATITMKPPRTSDATIWEKIRHGLLLLPIYYGIAPLRRLLALISFFEKHPNTDAWTLNLLAVAPNLQGRGIGTRLVKHALGNVPSTDEICVDTQRERNLRFYGRHGFKLVRKQHFDGGNEHLSFDSWSMIREVNTNIEAKNTIEPR